MKLRLALSPTQRRIAAVMLLLLALAAAATGIWLTQKRLHQRYADHIAGELDRLGRYQRIIAMRPELEKAITKVKDSKYARFYLTNSAPALAAAEIQQLVQAAVEANGLKLESTQIAPHKDEAEWRKVSANFKLRGKLPDVQKTLFALETAQPYLFIENLSINSRTGRGYKPVPGVEPDVMLQFDLHGYALIPAKPAANAPKGAA